MDTIEKLQRNMLDSWQSTLLLIDTAKVEGKISEKKAEEMKNQIQKVFEMCKEIGE